MIHNYKGQDYILNLIDTPVTWISPMKSPRRLLPAKGLSFWWTLRKALKPRL